MDLSEIPTYHAGIAQSKAHRSLGVLTVSWLKKHDITMLQWFILGLVYDADKEGMRITDIATRLDTTKGFVTNHINLLESKGLVSRSTDPNDTRSRIVKLTKDARPKVAKIELELRAVMRSTMYKTIKPEDLAVYIKVMAQLSKLGNYK